MFAFPLLKQESVFLNRFYHAGRRAGVKNDLCVLMTQSGANFDASGLIRVGKVTGMVRNSGH